MNVPISSPLRDTVYAGYVGSGGIPYILPSKGCIPYIRHKGCTPICSGMVVYHYVCITRMY